MDWTKFVQALDEADARQDWEWEKHHQQIPDKQDEYHRGLAWENVGAIDPSSGASSDEPGSDVPTRARQPSRVSAILYRLTTKPGSRRRELLMRGGAPEIPKAVPGFTVLRLYGRSSGRKTWWDLMFDSADQISDYIRALKIIESPWLAGASERERIALVLHRFAELMVRPLDPEQPRKELSRRFKIKYRRLCMLIERCDAAFQQMKDWFLIAKYINSNAPIGIFDDGHVVFLFLQKTGEGFIHDLDLGTYTPMSAELKQCFPWVQWAKRAVPP